MSDYNDFDSDEDSVDYTFVPSESQTIEEDEDEEDLFYALSNNDYEFIENNINRFKPYLLKSYSSAFQSGTFIQFVCKDGKKEILQIILQQQNINMDTNERGMTPFMFLFADQVIENNSQLESDLLECAKIFLKLKPDHVDINGIQNQKITCLMYAAQSGSKKIVQFLLDHGSEINAKDYQYWTALCYAVDKGHGDLARYLLENGANPHIITKQKFSINDLARNRGFTAIDQLIEHFQYDSLKRNLSSRKDNFVSDVQFLISELNLSENYSQLFNDHAIDVIQFLKLTNSDLNSIGVKKQNDKNKILKLIKQISKNKNSESLESIRDQFALSIYNTSNHLRRIDSNIRYLKFQIENNGEILNYGKDEANVLDLSQQITNSIQSNEEIIQSINKLSKLFNDPNEKSYFNLKTISLSLILGGSLLLAIKYFK